MPQVKVVVTLKPTLLDAQGRVVQDALHSLGYGDVTQVRIGKYMELEIADTAKSPEEVASAVKEMCDRLLANPVIENYKFDLLPASTDSASHSPAEGIEPASTGKE